MFVIQLTEEELRWAAEQRAAEDNHPSVTVAHKADRILSLLDRARSQNNRGFDVT
jgi:hypothetical protein